MATNRGRGGYMISSWIKSLGKKRGTHNRQGYRRKGKKEGNAKKEGGSGCILKSRSANGIFSAGFAQKLPENRGIRLHFWGGGNW